MDIPSDGTCMFLYWRCDLWHHMFTKEPQSPDFLQARFVHSSMKEDIKSYISWRLHCPIHINFWYVEKGHQAFTFITLGFMWKLSHKMSIFPYYQCSMLPARIPKVYTRSHLLYTKLTWSIGKISVVVTPILVVETAYGTQSYQPIKSSCPLTAGAAPEDPPRPCSRPWSRMQE